MPYLYISDEDHKHLTAKLESIVKKQPGATEISLSRGVPWELIFFIAEMLLKILKDAKSKPELEPLNNRD